MPALSNSSAFFSLQPVWEKASSLCSSCVCRHVFYAGTHRLSPGVFVGTQTVLQEAGNYNNDRYQWDLAKLSPNEYYRYLTTGSYPC